MANAQKGSKVETLKAESRQLRGSIAEELAADRTLFGDGNAGLLKFHGTYQQYDRDSATGRKQQGLEKEFQFMVRARIPGGRLTAAQYLAMDRLADAHANGTLRVTTRQGIQFHGVLKGELKPSIAAINDTLLTTLAACGDVVRNVMTTPAPIGDAVHRRLDADARLLSEALLPRTRAYHEIWLDGEPVKLEGDSVEPLYGANYLPRKFKIALATPEDNSVDVLTNDLAIVALFDGEQLQGYNLALGGGLGMTHNKPKTYPRLATPIAFIGPDDLVRGAEAVVALQRDHGDRSDRRHARLKYLVAEQGSAWIKAQLEQYFGAPLEDPRPMPRFAVRDHMGWHEQADGRLYLGLPIASGRILDHGRVQLRSGLRAVIERFALNPILTPAQDVILADIAPADRAAIEALLRAHGIVLAEAQSPIRRWTLACPALPTCGLALAEAERVREDLIDAVELVLARHGLAEERISIRMTGCPNGCARPYAGDIGLVGRTPGHYAIFVGGDFEGTRLNQKLVERVPFRRIADTLEPLFAMFAQERAADEGFGDFCHRVGLERLQRAAAGSELVAAE